MAENYIITIGRQSGSGGREIARKLSEKLGIKCYDKEILEKASKDSGFYPKFLELYDEKPTNSLLYSLAMGTYNFRPDSKPLMLQIYLAQFNSIKEIAARESCIIVGRCADYILTGYPNVVSVFVYGDLVKRSERMAVEMNLSPEEAEEYVTKTDKGRAGYYNYYTNKKWGKAQSYDLCIDSLKLGIDQSVELISQYINLKGLSDLSDK